MPLTPGQPLIDRTQLSPDVTIGLGPSTIGTNGQVLTVIGGVPVWAPGSGSGSVTSVSASSATLAITGSPITSAGTLTINLSTTAVSPGSYTSANITVDAYGRITAASNGSVGAGTVTSVAVTGANGIGVGGSPITTNGTIALTLGAITPTSVAASGTVTGSNLSGTNTGDQTITLTGDVTGTGTGSFATTINNSVASGTYNSVTVNTKGLVTGGTNVPYITSLPAFTASGDATGTFVPGTPGNLPLTLASVNANVGAFAGAWNATTISIPTFTVNAKGLLTAAGTTNVTRTIFGSGTQGEVPASGGGSTNFLRADGTWSTPSTNPGTVTSVAATGSTGLVVGGSPITGSGTLTFTLGTELQGLAGLGSVGFVQRTGAGLYTVASITSGQVTSALGYTPVPNSTMINTTSPLVGGGPLTSSLTISMPVFGGGSGNGFAGYVPAEAVVTSTKFLRDDAVWAVPPAGTVTSVQASGGTTGLTFSGGPITSSGTLTLSGTLAIANGGTGQITANAALNALLPTQTSNSGKFLTTDGTNTSWAVVTAVVQSFNTRTGAVTLNSTDVSTALGFTPLQNNQVVSLSGDATGTAPGAGNNVIPVTLATVNANVGSFGSSSAVATITVNAKGLVTAVSNTTITPAAIGAATINGSNATGTWAINISGNAATASNGGVTSVFGRTGAVVAASADYTFSQIGGSLAATQLPAFSGDVTSPAGSSVNTLATVNANVGTFGDATHVAAVTVNAKGLVTAVSNVAISAGGVGTVTSVSVTPGAGISASVATPTSTPNITITNTGVTSIAGTGGQINASAATGAVTLSLPATLSVNISGNAATASNGGVTSITGTANQIAASSSTGAITLSLPTNVIIPTPLSGTALTVNNSSGGATVTALIASSFTSSAANPLLSLKSTAASGFATLSISGNGVVGTNDLSIFQNGSTLDATILNRSSANLLLGTNSSTILTISSAGLAVTGTLSSGTFTTSGNVVFSTGSASTVSPSPTTYGSLSISGSSGGYAGIQFPATTNNRTFMISTSGAISGVYAVTTATWDWYWNNGVLTVGTVPGTQVTGTVPAATLASTITNASSVANTNFNVALLNGTTVTFAAGSEFTGNPSTGVMNAVSFNTTSDRNAKKNIRPIAGALDIISHLHGVKFDWKHTNIPSVGLIAQDVQMVLPELVTEGANERLSLNYSGIVGVLVEAMKEMKTEHKAEIAALRAEIEALKGK